MKVVIIEFPEVREMIQLIRSLSTRFFESDAVDGGGVNKVSNIVKELLEAYMGVEEPDDLAAKDLISMNEISLLMEKIVSSECVNFLVDFEHLKAISLLDNRGSVAFLIGSAR